jgi:RHS repeat-associated protein
MTGVSGAASATFIYDGDGNRVKGTAGGVTTTYIGNYFEWVSSTSNMVSYYYAGSTRIAMRTGTGSEATGLKWLLGDHLGSTSYTAEGSTGAETGEVRYKPWGEDRHTEGTTPTSYRFTGQRSEMGSIGLYFYGARWYDPALGRFSSADTIIPQSTQGTQAWDRYGGMNNNPVKYNDPSGHCILCFVAAIGGGVILGTAIYNNFIREPSEPADINASNPGDLLIAGYEHAGHANITGEGLQSLQDDPSINQSRDRLLDQITGKPYYGEEAFTLKDLTDPQMFTAMGDNDAWWQAALNGDDAFFMVYHAKLQATNINVSADGTIDLTWKIEDTFDFKPDMTRGVDYNAYAIPIYFLYNIIGGAGDVPITASWDETIAPE